MEEFRRQRDEMLDRQVRESVMRREAEETGDPLGSRG
jgi:hypothetical protein